MDVRCDKCQTVYALDEQTLGDAGITVKCVQCGHLFRVRRKSSAPPPSPRDAKSADVTPVPAGTEASGDKTWMVRIAKTQETFRLKELTTLQQWIVEGRVTRGDEISLGGTKWKEIGGIPDLQPFFELVAKVKTTETDKTVTEPASTRQGPSRELGGIAEHAERNEQRTALSRSSILLPVLLVLAAGGGGYGYYRGWFSLGGLTPPAAKHELPPKVAEVAVDSGMTSAASSGALDEAHRALVNDSDEALVDAARRYRALTTDPKLAGVALIGEARAETMRGRYLFEQAQSLSGAGVEGAKRTLEHEASGRLQEAKAALDDAATHGAPAAALAVAKADYLVATKATDAEVGVQLAIAKMDESLADDVAYCAAQLASQQGKRADAIALLRDHDDPAVTTTPTRNLYFAAQLFLLEGNKAEAKKCVDAILQRFPQHDRAQTLLASIDVPAPVAAKAGKVKATIVGEPKVGTERAAAPSQGTADYRNLVAQAGKLFAEGKVKMARQMYQSALVLSPNGIEALRGWAFCDLDTERFLVAVDEFRRVLARQPADSEALIGLGESYRRANMMPKAQEIFSRYIQQLPHGPRIKFAQKRLAELTAAPAITPPVATPTAIPTSTPLPRLPSAPAPEEKPAGETSPAKLPAEAANKETPKDNATKDSATKDNATKDEAAHKTKTPADTSESKPHDPVEKTDTPSP